MPTLKKTVYTLFVTCLVAFSLPLSSHAFSLEAEETLTPKTQQILSSAGQIVQRVMQANNVPDNRVKALKLLKGNAINASTDGQTIYFTAAIWEAMPGDGERAFVLSHELSHILLGHINETALRRAGLGLLQRYVFPRVVRSESQVSQLVESIGLSLVDMKFSRTMEYQADDLGIKLMQRADYNPKAAVSAFNVLLQSDKNGPPEFLRSHPLSKARIQTLAKKYSL